MDSLRTFKCDSVGARMCVLCAFARLHACVFRARACARVHSLVLFDAETSSHVLPCTECSNLVEISHFEERQAGMKTDRGTRTKRGEDHQEKCITEVAVC